MTDKDSQVSRDVDFRNEACVSGFQVMLFVMLPGCLFFRATLDNPLSDPIFHLKSEDCVILFLLIADEPLQVRFTCAEFLVLTCDFLRLFLRIEVRNDHVTVLAEGLVDVLYIYIMPGAVNNMTLFFVFAKLSVDKADSLDSIDIADFLVQE